MQKVTRHLPLAVFKYDIFYNTSTFDHMFEHAESGSLVLNCNMRDRIKLFAKFKTHPLFKSCRIDPLNNDCWKKLETVTSHIKPKTIGKYQNTP